MDAEQVERQLRKQVEEHVGRPLSDDEWETFKRIQLQSAQMDREEGGTVARRWTLRGTAAWIAALASALAGVGMLLQWEVVFSPFVRVPLGIFIWLIALAAFGIWVAGIFRSGFRGDEFEGFLGWGGWLVSVWIIPVGFFSLGAVVLSHQSRGYWTSTHVGFFEDWTPAEFFGLSLILASIALAWVGRPSRYGRR